MPTGIVFAEVDTTTGGLATLACPVTARETFLADTLPGPCEDHGYLGDRIETWWNRFREWLRR